MKRVIVVGNSGSGKTTLARTLATRLGLPRIELDALFHGPGWTPRPTFANDVERATARDAWVVDGNYYPDVGELLWSRADTVVWLDLPKLLVEWQVVRRSLLRWLARDELWNGNREKGPLDWLDPGHPIRWSWAQHGNYRARYATRFDEPHWAHLARIRLRSRAAVRAFVRTLPR